MTKQKMETKTEENVMRKIKIDKIMLSVGGTGDYVEKGFRLIKYLTNKKPVKTRAQKRIPTWGVRPGLEVGAVITLRRDYEELLRRMLASVENILRKRSVSENTLAFGIKEYIEIPGVEYQRDIGIMGFDVIITFKRTGRRVKLRKIKRGKIPKKQIITKEEIVKFMEETFGTKFKK